MCLSAPKGDGPLNHGWGSVMILFFCSTVYLRGGEDVCERTICMQAGKRLY